MTENTQDNQTELEEVTPTELELLKQRARAMGIEFSNNIKVETLRKKIEDAMSGSTEVAEVQTEETNALTGVAKKVKTPSLRQHQQAEQMRLVRLRITNMDPKKKDVPGEIVTVANEVVGTVRKYIPFGEFTDDGYHVPYILYRELEARRFLHITVKKDKRTGTNEVKTAWVKEFALEVLPDLTQAELARLANAQAAAAGDV